MADLPKFLPGGFLNPPQSFLKVDSVFLAGLTALLCAAWSLPIYSGAMPSWYNLFLAVFGVAALFRYLETEQRRWLFVAGVLGGMSILFKMIGLYYVAGVLLFLAYHEQVLARKTLKAPSEGGRNYLYLIAFGLLLFIGMLAAVVRMRPNVEAVIHFVLPGAAIVVLVLAGEHAEPRGRLPQRAAGLLRLTVPFGLGVLIPIVVFLIPYLLTDSLAALADDLFGAPASQAAFAYRDMPGLHTFAAALPVVALFGLAPRWHGRISWLVGTAAAIAAGVLLLAAGNQAVYRTVWHSMRALGPVTVVAGAWYLERRRVSTDVADIPDLPRQQIVLLLSITAVCGLVQFPMAGPIYFFYFAPLMLLAGVALISQLPSVRPKLTAAALTFYLLFAVFWIHPGYIWAMGERFVRADRETVLSTERGGGIRVNRTDAALYPRLIAEIRAHAQDGFIYVTPDAPEVYFLAGFNNLTRTFFDFADDPVGRTARILDMIERRRVRVVVINRFPGFSGNPPTDLIDSLETRYPNAKELDHFVVRWIE
ncbi:MAG: hypothetical protein IH968_06165 [Gemmatimonadetes bacterium]|nr:hypothetical protein [Gemmatimonadota bacterium]